jgi:hypothetical protein
MAIDYSNWMRDTLAFLGPQQLRQISMPASHDAGMSISQNCAAFANSCNTRTQTKNILGQLQAGIRYFDIRPVISGGQLYTAHLSDGGIGCNGERMQDVLNAVSSFIARSGDLVILKFSHYYDRDAGRSGFTTSQMQMLIDRVSSALQRFVYSGTTAQGAGDLARITLQTYIGSKGMVLTVYDQLPSNLWNPRTGVYRYADKPAAGDLIVYDVYSSTNNLDTMTANQLGKLDDPSNHGSNSLFLLSWTLTQDAAQATACQFTPNDTQIITMAQSAKRVLQQNMQDQYYAGKITPEMMPNMLYTDACDSSITDTALWLNQQLYGPK